MSSYSVLARCTFRIPSGEVEFKPTKLHKHYILRAHKKWQTREKMQKLSDAGVAWVKARAKGGELMTTRTTRPMGTRSRTRATESAEAVPETAAAAVENEKAKAKARTRMGKLTDEEVLAILDTVKLTDGGKLKRSRSGSGPSMRSRSGPSSSSRTRTSTETTGAKSIQGCVDEPGPETGRLGGRPPPPLVAHGCLEDEGGAGAQRVHGGRVVDTKLLGTALAGRGLKRRADDLDEGEDEDARPTRRARTDDGAADVDGSASWGAPRVQRSRTRVVGILRKATRTASMLTGAKKSVQWCTTVVGEGPSGPAHPWLGKKSVLLRAGTMTRYSGDDASPGVLGATSGARAIGSRDYLNAYVGKFPQLDFRNRDALFETLREMQGDVRRLAAKAERSWTRTTEVAVVVPTHA